MLKNILTYLLLLPLTLVGQTHPLDVFDHLLNKKWSAEGTWGDGSTFKQEVYFESDLKRRLILSKTKGFTDKAQTQFGWRNHGVRQWNQSKSQLEFWEFDVFGGLTSGVVLVRDKDMLYQYQYGDSFVTDAWEYLNDSTYQFTVGSYKEGEWEQVYLKTQFKSSLPDQKRMAFEKMKEQIAGNWVSEAWDGQLREVWQTDQHNDIVQSAQYTEGGKVLYEATNKVEYINGELILLTVIKNGTPKIFKAVLVKDKTIVFENTDYSNPSQVIYTFEDADHFKRQINGIEKGEASSYTFHFKRQK